MKPVIINGHKVGPGYPPYVVAEAGVNHCGMPRVAHLMIDAAKEAGADAVKFQIFNPQKMLGRTEENRELLKGLTLPAWTWEDLAYHARRENMDFIVSVFDYGSLRRALNADVDAVKLAHSEATNPKLIKAVARLSPVPVIMSVLGCDDDEVIDTLGTESLILLYCIPEYPAPKPDYEQMRLICTIGNHYQVPSGFSDHTDCGSDIAAEAVQAGACMLEKHFTLDRTMQGPDHHMSFEPDELAAYIGKARGK